MNDGRIEILRRGREARGTVNPQVTDAVTQTDVKVAGKAPAMAMSSPYQMMTQSVGLTMQNAVSAGS